MPVLNASEGIHQVEQFMSDLGGRPKEWYVGVAGDAAKALARQGFEGKPSARWWEFESEGAAEEAAGYLKEKGLRPDKPVPDEDGPRRWVYAFHAPGMARFLDLVERAEREEKTPKHEHIDRQQEWVAAVNRLLRLLMGWVLEITPPHVPIIKTFPIWVTERRMGGYEVSGVSFGLRLSRASIRPVARNVLGGGRLPDGTEWKAEGLVAITGDGRKYNLYRRIHDGTDFWYVHEEATELAEMKELDRDRFLAVLGDALS